MNAPYVAVLKRSGPGLRGPTNMRVRSLHIDQGLSTPVVGKGKVVANKPGWPRL